MHGQSAKIPKPGNRFRDVVKATMDTRQFEYVGRDSKGHVRLRHLLTGQVVKYSTHNGGDIHAPRNFAKEVERLTGHKIWNRGSKK